LIFQILAHIYFHQGNIWGNLSLLLLKRNYFSGWRINWNDKASNIRALLNELNLGESSVIFIDDNPIERDWVKKRLYHFNPSKAKEREEVLDYETAIEIWEGLGQYSEAARIRKVIEERDSIKVDQTVVQGDQVTKTEIKDSVLNRSNVGGGSSKMQELKDLTEMKKEGLIDDDEFKQMKKEILGK